jgi:HSP20 family molecular chaperone IbpA
MSTQEVTKQEVKGTEGTRPGRWYQPAIDICENSESLWLWADMPGVDDKNVDINLSDGVLTIEGRIATAEYDGLQPTYSEYNVGNFHRRLSVSDDFDVDRISARMKEGVLEIQLPKAERVKARKIQVQAS